jgi:hypothetical protein
MTYESLTNEGGATHQSCDTCDKVTETYNISNASISKAGVRQYTQTYQS